MKALVIEKPQKIVWQEITEPTPGPDEVLIRVKAGGICGTDIHILHGEHGAVTYPRIPGHELVGEVIGLGTEVSHIRLGEPVAIDPVVSCGECAMCQAGRPNICHQVKCLGVQTEGGFTETIRVKAHRVYPFSPDVPWDIAALVEPFSIAAQIAHRLRIEGTDKVLIVGGGTIGLALLQVVQGIYNAQAVVADISQYKLSLAREIGAFGVIDSAKENPVQKAREIWHNSGPTAIVEAAGNSKLLNDIINNAPPGSRIGVIGFMTDPVNIAPVDITKRELEIIGSRLNNNKFSEVLKWFKEGRLQAPKLISHKFKFAEAPKAFAAIENEPEKMCKVILEF